MTDETTRPRPRAGWYPDPAPGQDRQCWWDGWSWTPGQNHRPLAPNFSVLGLGVGILVALVGLVSAAEFAVYAWGSGAVADELERHVTDSASTFDNLDRGLSLTATAVLLIGAVLWCVWQHKLASAAMPAMLRRQPGMHAGSWFIPVVALWFPLQNMRDLWRVYLPDRGRGLLGWWWAFWVLSNLVDRSQAAIDVRSVDDFRTYNSVGMFDELISMVSAALAVLVVVRLTRAATGSRARTAATVAS